MALRLYFSGQLDSDFAPTFDWTFWGGCSALPHLQLVRTKNVAIGGGLYESTPRSYDVETYTASPARFMSPMFVSPPLAAQTISGQVKGQIQAWTANAALQACTAVHIRVMGKDGTVRGTLLEYAPSSLVSGITTTKTNRNFPPPSELTPVVCQDGDRILIEMGVAAFGDLASHYQAHLQTYLNPALADLPEDETTTDELNSWIEFSQDLLLLEDAGNHRFYLPTISGDFPMPAPSSLWDYTADLNDSYRLSTILRVDSSYNFDNWSCVGSDYGSPPLKYLAVQFVSRPLAPQIISGTVKGQCPAYYADYAALTACAAAVIRVVAPDGTVRGTLMSYLPGTAVSPFPEATATNRYYPPLTTVTEVEAQDGDLLVVEYGIVAFDNLDEWPSGVTVFNHDCTVGDLPEDETTTDTLNSWIEFSQDIQYMVREEPPAAPENYNFEGNMGLSLTPSAQSVQSFSHPGNMVLAPVPSATSFADYIHHGDVVLSLLPELVFRGNMPLALTPGGQNYADYRHTGNIILGLSPHAVSGWLHLGNIPVALTPSALTTGPPEIIVSVAGSDGFVRGGAGVITSFKPLVSSIVPMVGGYLLGSKDALDRLVVTRPPVKHLLGNVSFVRGGAGILSHVGPSLIKATSLVGSKGWVFGRAGIITSSKPKSISILGSGGFALGGFGFPLITVFRPREATHSVGSIIAFGLGGEGIWTVSRAKTTSIISEGIAFVRGGEGPFESRRPLVFHIGSPVGFVLAGGMVDTLFETWVLTGNNFDPSFYANFDFNSYATFRGKVFAAREDGIYVLGADTDQGEEIQSGVRIGPTNLGRLAEKRLRALAVGECGENVLVRVRTREKEGTFQVKRGYVTISSNLQDREHMIDIVNFERIGNFEIIPLILARR